MRSKVAVIILKELKKFEFLIFSLFNKTFHKLKLMNVHSFHLLFFLLKFPEAQNFRSIFSRLLSNQLKN